jgi:tRNA dimethylallyltransferase
MQVSFRGEPEPADLPDAFSIAVMAAEPDKPAVTISGPTGSGKSALAVALAREFDGEVVSCDAMQVYRGFDIGTAKLSPAGRHGVPHHLIDIREPTEMFSAGEFAALAREAICGIIVRRRLPIVAGGTGFYLRALFEGLFEGPARRPELRERLRAMEARSPGRVHRLLRRLDPETAARVHPNDLNKAIRAAEVSIAAGAPMSGLQRAGRSPLRGVRPVHFFLDPDRAELYRRINQRCEEMFRSGLIEEARNLLARGVPRTAQPFLAVGYREALGVIDGRLSEEAALALTQQATRRYAKRQWTWFRRNAEAIRLPGFGSDPQIFSRARAIVGELLNFRGER